MDIQQHGNQTVIRLPERVDISNTQDVISGIRAEMAQGRRHFVLNAADTTAIDSTALGAIMQLYKALRVGEGNIVLAGVGPNVQRLLSLTRLDRVLETFDDVSAAVQKAA